MKIINDVMSAIMQPINYVLVNYTIPIVFGIVGLYGLWWIWKWWTGESE